MDWVAIVSLIAAVSSAAAAVFGVAHAARTFRRNAELQAFLVLTDRYESIMNELPPSARASFDWPDDVDPDMAIRMRYLNLCSEEYYLKERELLSERVWGIWEREMCFTLSAPPYVSAWEACSEHFASYPEFSAFVSDAQSRGATRRQQT
jgi:hypothetical protein